MLKNQELFEESKKFLPGGVNSPVRAMKPDFPFFVSKAQGPYLYDVEGNQFIDFCLGYGPMIFGHANEDIMSAVRDQLNKGSLYGTPTKLEIEFAKKITELIPNVDMIRCVNTGTEATMNSLRLARGFTSRDKVIKFMGAFHGAHDYLLVKAGSGALTHAVPDSLGIPVGTTANTLLCEFNDPEDLTSLFEKHKDEVACVIIEPIIGNAGCILPEPGYLSELQKICTENDALLIFDEVITGFQLGLGGAQEFYGMDADIITMGKIIGGGFPIGIFGARKEIMENITPLGKIYNAGTFNGNPISVSAGLATIELLEKTNPYPNLIKGGNAIRSGLSEIFPNNSVQGVVGMFCMYFSESPVTNYAQATQAVDIQAFLRYQREMMKQGVFHPPSQYECNFLSTSHTPEIIENVLERAKKCKL